MESFNVTDVAAAALVLASAFFAFQRGFVREAFAIAGWVGAAVAAWYGFPEVEVRLRPWIPGETLRWAVAGGGAFLVAVAVFALAIRFLSRSVRNSPLSALDRALGFLFGAARGVVVVALLFVLGKSTLWNTPEETPQWLAGAASYSFIEYSAEMVERAIPEDLLSPPDAPADPVPADAAGADIDGARPASGEDAGALDGPGDDIGGGEGGASAPAGAE